GLDAGAEIGAADGVEAGVGLGVALGEQAAIAPMSASARRTRLIMVGNLRGWWAGPSPALRERWPCGPPDDRTQRPPTGALRVHCQTVAGASQATAPSRVTSVIRAIGKGARGWERPAVMLRSSTPHLHRRGVDVVAGNGPETREASR